VGQGCLQGFNLWQKGKQVGPEAQNFQIRLEMQAARLRAWMRKWAIERGSESPLLQDPNFKADPNLPIYYILTIYSTLDSLGDLKSEFPVLSSAANVKAFDASSLHRMAEMNDQSSADREYWVRKMNELQEDSPIRERVQWALRDGRAMKTLELVKSMIDELYSFLPPPRGDPTDTVVWNQSLPSTDVQMLEAISRDSDANPLLQGLAQLRSTKLQEDILERIKVNEKLRVFKGVMAVDARNNRDFGKFRGHDAMVEWKMVDGKEPPGDMTSGQYMAILERRIKNIARLLKSQKKPDEVRTLTCLGVVNKPGATDDITQYGIVYKVPPGDCCTLRSLLIDEDRYLMLGDRFSVALMLSKAALFLHLAGWLHKGIRSDNVLFFLQEDGAINPEEPYLVGFEYSRENAANTQTEMVVADIEFNLYRHPDVQGLPLESSEGESGKGRQDSRPRFRQTHDLYSLGVVLLEIGLRKPVSSMMWEAERNPQYGKHSAGAFRTWMVETKVPRLGPLMGEAYRDAVARCLRGDFAVDDNTSVEQAFYIEVVSVLANCRL
jgi:hypothetical protein